MLSLYNAVTPPTDAIKHLEQFRAAAITTPSGLVPLRSRYFANESVLENPDLLFGGDGESASGTAPFVGFSFRGGGKEAKEPSVEVVLPFRYSTSTSSYNPWTPEQVLTDPSLVEALMTCTVAAVQEKFSTAPKRTVGETHTQHTAEGKFRSEFGQKILQTILKSALMSSDGAGAMLPSVADLRQALNEVVDRRQDRKTLSAML